MTATSIRLNLLKWLLGPILLANLVLATLVASLAWAPAQVAFDAGLADSANALAQQLAAGVTPTRPPPASGVERSWLVVRAPGDVHIAGNSTFPPLRPGEGPYDAAIGEEAVRVVALAVDTPAGPREFGVARTLRQRDEVRAAIVSSLVVLVTLVTIILVGVVWLSVGNGLRPLARIRAELAAREPGDLAPIPAEQVPYEIAPVVRGFNELLDKVELGARAQSDFIADMAHQLRTPLAGIQLQLEWLRARHTGDADTGRALAMMELSNERMIRQVNQLLALGRAREGQPVQMHAPLDLADLIQESIGYFVGKAAEKDIDIGFELSPVLVDGDAFQLRDLVDNLVDNALRYTPECGRVTVSCKLDGGTALFMVEDSGPGIPKAKRAAVFERHVRLDDKTVGSGLGLAIVRDIALAHGGKAVLRDAPGGGTRARVRFPAVSSRATQA